MDLNSYIYEFLHDPRKNRWPQPVVDYLLQLADKDITSKVNVFLKTRDINRELAQLKQLGTEDKTVELTIQNGQSVYDLPEDFLRVSSVLYEGCFIPHLIPDCGDTAECDECGDVDPHSVIRSYNTSGLPKGKIKLSPTPKSVIKTCGTETIKITQTYRKVEVLNEESTLGWGYLNVLPKRNILDEEDWIPEYTTEVVKKDNCNSCCPQEEEETDECAEEDGSNVEYKERCVEKVHHLKFGKLEVTYESLKKLKFDNNDDEVRKALLDDDQLKKFFVCGHLLRDDKDSNSRSLGAEELQLYEQRIVTLLGEYAELYDKDNVLEINSAVEGYVDPKVNESILVKDLVTAERVKAEAMIVNAENDISKAEADILAVETYKLEKEEAKAKAEAREKGKAKFDVLGVR